MSRNLIAEIIKKKNNRGEKIKEKALQVTLSRIKKRHDLRSIEQAACFYIKKQHLGINVSSIIDDVTRQTVQTHLASSRQPIQATTPSPPSSPNKNLPKAPKVKWVPSTQYTLASKLSYFYPYLFIFENALRIKIDEVMSNAYTNWWDTRLKTDLFDIWQYAADEASKQSKLPMLGGGQSLQPLEYLTIGHLEQIIVKYNSLFMPAVFPNLQFFTGHMVIVKRVRNAIAHMAPCTTATDIRNAKNEIDILLQHLATV